jgi:hypothetical protein
MKTLTGKIAEFVFAMTLAAVCCQMALGQDSSDQGSGGAAPAATGPDTTTQTIENPPVSGLDQPSFEPGFGARSYLIPHVHVSEAVTTNPTNSLSSTSSIKDVTRGFGSLTLQKMWRIHPLDVDYTGGATWYHGQNSQVFQVHTLAATQRILWRTGQLALRDTFSYLPQGGFGLGSFGGSGGLGGGIGGGTGGGIGGGVFGNGQFGSIGNQPRITNMGIVDITQSLSPRTSIVLAGGYGLTDFLNNPQGFINSQQTTLQVGYNYQLTRHDQIALSYDFQQLHFPKANQGNVKVNVWQVVYGHRISGKLDLTLAGGPQWVQANSPSILCAAFDPTTGQCVIYLPNPTTSRSYIAGAGRATLIYSKSLRTNMTVGYSHYTNPGSGFFAAATTDAVHSSLSYRLARRWTASANAGYSSSSRVLSGTTSTAGNASKYNYWFAGGAMRRQLGRQFGAFASYQFDQFHFGSGFCTSNPNCNSGYDRHVGLIGLDWSPPPIRLD